VSEEEDNFSLFNRYTLCSVFCRFSMPSSSSHYVFPLASSSFLCEESLFPLFVVFLSETIELFRRFLPERGQPFRPVPSLRF